MRYSAHSLAHWFLLGMTAAFGGVVMSSCASTEGWTKADWELAALGISPEDRARDDKTDELWHAYIHQVLYVSMPEEEFVQLFTQSQSQVDDRPYIIIQQSGHRYVFLEFPRYSKDKARVMFVNGKLAKYERYGLGENPWGYTDCTFLLRPAKGVPAKWE